ncbi:uncharacterized protein LOC141828971 [Curcuma longa]|uniref:uncharacterized protein LOC141828971 n=1 Tax=Curcuma longa TaxID=136217 RepID=UPI003D9DBFA3
MLSNVGTGIPGSIDPNLDRETTDNGKKWAVKRARTSFSGGRKKKSVRRISKETQLILDKGPSGTGEMPLSDSEKVGVSILGQHFSDSLKIVPIKKRRLLFVRSPSSPLQSSYSDYSDHLLESQSASESLAYGNDHDKRFIDNKKPISKHVIEGTSDAADFSGISILAAAACNSEMVGESINLGCLVPTENSLKEVNLESTGDKKEFSLCQKDLQVQSLEDLQDDRLDMETHSISVPVEDENKFHDSQNKNGSSLQNVNDNIKSAFVSRLHWDLNTDMDAWNSNCDDLVISDPVVTDPLCENREHDSKLLGCETCEKELEDGEKQWLTKLGKSLDIPGFNSLKEAPAKPDIGNHSSLDHENVCSFANGNNLVEKVHSLDDVTVSSSVCSSEEAKLMHGTPGINICCAEVISSEVGIALGSSRDGSLANEATKKAVDKMDSDLGLKTEPVLYHAPLNENVTCEINTELDKPLSNMVQLIHKPICNENVNIIASSSEKLPDDNHVINTLVESSDQFLLVAACDSSDGTIHSDKSDGSKNIHVDKPSGVMSSSPSLVGHQQNSREAWNPGEQIIAAKCEYIRAALMVDDDNFAGSKSPVCAPAVPKSVEEPVVDIKETEATCKSNKNVCQISHGDSHLDAFQVGDVVTEHEKSNLVGDDDSQFEDGEFRESVLHCWGEDDEVESEHVDYGSDNGENDISEAVSVLPSSATLSVENMTFKGRNLASADEVRAGKDRQVIFPQQPSSGCSSKSDGPDAGQVKRTTADIDHKKHLANNKNSMERDLTGCNNECDTSREPLLNVRMKSSGWDQLPEGSRHAGDSLLDHGIASTRQDDPSCSLRLFVDDESLRRSGSSFKGALSSRVEAPNSSDETCRKDKFYVRSRYSGRDSLEAKTKRNAIHNSSGWGGSSQHAQSRVRDEPWFDSPNSRGPRHHGSPGYYDPSSFVRPSSGNAAAAAVKKVESNGFVVAPDGTLVKAGGATSAGRVTKKPVNGSLQSAHPSRWGLQRRLQNSRDVSPDRHFTVGRGQTGRYVHELDSDQYGRSIPHDRTESSLSGHHLSTRDRSYSPNRRSLRLPHPHIRSRSRSRTRSPIRCTSPRGRHDIGVNNVPGFRRHRRSPVARMERMRSPNPRDSFDEQMIFYDSASVALASPSHSTRWIDERKESPNHLKEHGYKRSSGRSPPMRVYNDHRLGFMESLGRSKPSDYFRSLQSSRKTEYADYSRGFKYDSSNDRRGQDGRDNYLRSVRQYDNNKKRIR